MATGFSELLRTHRKRILKDWFEETIRTYPPDTATFLKAQSDQFANPVGNTINKGLEAIFDAVVNDADRETLVSFLDPIIRVRAVQAFTPSQAVSFLLFLKAVVRKAAGKESGAAGFADDHLAFESRIDEVMLLAFNLYMECRERLAQIRANEAKNTAFGALVRAGVVREEPESGNDG